MRDPKRAFIKRVGIRKGSDYNRKKGGYFKKWNEIFYGLYNRENI